MALTFRLDTQQALDIVSGLKSLTDAVNNLSANLGKWQGKQNDTIENAFTDLIASLEGADEDVQPQINEFAARIRSLRERLQTSINKQPKE